MPPRAGKDIAIPTSCTPLPRSAALRGNAHGGSAAKRLPANAPLPAPQPEFFELRPEPPVATDHAKPGVRRPRGAAATAPAEVDNDLGVWQARKPQLDGALKLNFELAVKQVQIEWTMPTSRDRLVVFESMWLCFTIT